MIEGICFTNLNGYTCPIKKFVAVPRVGEKVTVSNKNGDPVTLTVTEVTHAQKGMDSHGDPFIIVRLNK